MTPPLRAAHVVATVGATGVESHIFTLLSSFDRSEVDPVLYVPRPGPLVERLSARGIPVEYGAPTRKLDWGAASRLSARWAGAYDVVHAHGSRASFWALEAARRAGVGAFITTVHELRWRTLRPGLRRVLWTALESRIMRQSDALVCVSGAARDALLDRHPELRPRTHVVHGSAPMLLDPEALPRAEPGRRKPGELRLVTVGRLEWEKGYDLLLPALAALARAGVDFVIDIVGVGVLEPELRAAAERASLDLRIRWLGRRHDVQDVLSAAHAFVTATRGETFGIAALEAMAIGLPVVAPAVGGLVELVEDGATGVLVPFDPEQTLPARLAEVISRWAVEPEETQRLGDRGARRAREIFAPSRLAHGVSDVYRWAMVRSTQRRSGP